MNEIAAEMLVAAAMKGVQQIRGEYRTLHGYCALGVLGFWDDMTDFMEHVGALGLDGRRQCPECLWCGAEHAVLVHMNDEHGWSFLDIARKFAADPGSGAEPLRP